MKRNRQTFNEMAVELDATLTACRVRIAHKQGYAPHTLAKRFNMPSKRIKKLLAGVVCTARTPRLPERICPKRSALWGVPILRVSCSKERLRRHGEFHRDAFIARQPKH